MKFIFLLGVLLSSASFANSGGGHGGGGAAELLTLDPLVINLRDGHYIQFKAHLKLKDAKDMEWVKNYVPVLRFELIKSLIGKSVAEVQTVEFIHHYSEAAAEAINKALRDECIKELLFDSWLIQ